MTATWLSIPPPLQLVVGALYGLLSFASLVAVTVKRRSRELRARMLTWWALVAAFTVALLAGHAGAVLLGAGASFLALREFLRLVPLRPADRSVVVWAYAAIPLQYAWVWFGWYNMFIAFIPVFMFLFLSMRMTIIGDTDGYLRASGTLTWGLMMTVFGLSHAAYLVELPTSLHADGSLATAVFLVALTQLNDVAQYVWGRSCGRRRALPAVSPNKTVAGVVGGLVTTVVLAIAAGPDLVGLSRFHAALAGVLIALGGFTGDVVMSSVKRDMRVKDTGTLLPGHGGILDRVDSLTFTAPLFLHFLRVVG